MKNKKTSLNAAAGNASTGSAVPTGETTGKQAMMFQPNNANIVAGLVGVVGGGTWGGGEIGIDGTRHRSDGLFRNMHVNGLPIAWPGQYPYFRRVLMDPSVRIVRAISVRADHDERMELVGGRRCA